MRYDLFAQQLERATANILEIFSVATTSRLFIKVNRNSKLGRDPFTRFMCKPHTLSHRYLL